MDSTGCTVKKAGLSLSSILFMLSTPLAKSGSFNIDAEEVLSCKSV